MTWETSSILFWLFWTGLALLTLGYWLGIYTASHKRVRDRVTTNRRIW